MTFRKTASTKLVHDRPQAEQVLQEGRKVEEQTILLKYLMAKGSSRTAFPTRDCKVYADHWTSESLIGGQNTVIS